jgi:hypothetical protein
LVLADKSSCWLGRRLTRRQCVIRSFREQASHQLGAGPATSWCRPRQPPLGAGEMPRAQLPENTAPTPHGGAFQVATWEPRACSNHQAKQLQATTRNDAQPRGTASHLPAIKQPPATQPLPSDTREARLPRVTNTSQSLKHTQTGPAPCWRARTSPRARGTLSPPWPTRATTCNHHCSNPQQPNDRAPLRLGKVDSTPIKAWCRTPTAQPVGNQHAATVNKQTRKRWRGGLRRAPRAPRRRDAWHGFPSLQKA